ncbi:MAG TPA: hypothetical protein VN476_03180, partial [Pyrinomonadaceae bacterium]|nr:hypothetical protein [Pyrinomonadaceae bacterium]
GLAIYLMNPDRQDQTERERILARYFNVASIKGDNRQIVKRFLLGALWAAVLTPLLFYLKFGTLNWFSISFTIFLVVLCLLFALGFFFQTRTEYHTRVPIEGNLADRIGAFWLVACAFGPFFGWIITSFSPTESSWKWQYMARAFLSVILPVITAVPLVPYARGKAALIAIPLLLAITALPVTSSLWVLADLHDGPETVMVDIWRVPATGKFDCVSQTSSKIACEDIRPGVAGVPLRITWLPHSRRVLSKRRVIA